MFYIWCIVVGGMSLSDTTLTKEPKPKQQLTKREKIKNSVNIPINHRLVYKRIINKTLTLKEVISLVLFRKSASTSFFLYIL
jgi:hypothetical protein